MNQNQTNIILQRLYVDEGRVIAKGYVTIGDKEVECHFPLFEENSKDNEEIRKLLEQK